jgi:hypothetical protein
VFGDLQRWFIRQTAKNMRNQISGQVRRTLGGTRPTSDVWDTATNEIPPEVGESPECQWCPICRAARRMRDSGPGIGGQISGAGDVVASAVQDAIGALDSLLGKASGTGSARDSGTGSSRDSTVKGNAAGSGPARDSWPGESAPPESAPSDTSDASASSGTSADSAAGSASPHSATAPEQQDMTSSQPGRDRPAPDPRRDRHGLVGLPGGGDSAVTESVAGGTAHGNGSGPAAQSADRLATAPGSEPDPWGAATRPTEADGDTDADDNSDGPAHGPDDRR